MADRWEIRLPETGDMVEVWRNGAWYSDEEDEQDALGLVRNRRATEVRVVEADGTARTQRV